ncbi:HAD family hydrolase [Kitasatospora sp. NPDC101235]|uniref:HAD family hydrolase n=1 Tax=Kitasatospora sp. NPDC101235 TaxID=3364101 RepID=UPI0037FD19D8
MTTSPATRFGAVVFDFFGVLTFNMVEVIQAFEDREKIVRGTFLRGWASPKGQELFRRLELGQITQEEWNSSFGDLIKVEPADLMARYLHDAFPAYPVLNVARQARAAGIKTAVLSNSLGRQPFDPYSGFDLTGAFDVVVLSADVGVRKPDPAIFRIVVDRLGVSAEECLFVDDSEMNLEAAAELGFTPLLGLDEDVVARRLRELLHLPGGGL